MLRTSTPDKRWIGSVASSAVRVAGFDVVTRWDALHRSFKGAALQLCAAQAECFGFRRLAIPSCSIGVIDLAEWCAARRFELTVFLPAEQDSGSPLGDFTRGDDRIKVHAVPGGWSTVHAAFWAFTHAQRDIYPIYPSGDPWYLAALRNSAAQVLQAFPDRPIVVPCSSGLHLLAYLEEAEALEATNRLLGVQLRGFDPLAAGFSGTLADASTCEIPSMLSQAPVNAERIQSALRRRLTAHIRAVSAVEVHAVNTRLEALILERLGTVDDSLAACLAAAEAERLEGPVLLSTARTARHM